MINWDRLQVLYDDRWAVEAQIIEAFETNDTEELPQLECSLQHIKDEISRLELLAKRSEGDTHAEHPPL